MLFYTAVSSALLLYILIQHNDGLERQHLCSNFSELTLLFRYVWNNNYLGFALEMWSVLVVHGLMFLQLLFCWWSWGKVHDNGFLFKILSPGLAIFILHQIRISSKEQRITAAGTLVTFRASLILIKHLENLLYSNEITNLILLFLTSCFPDMLVFFDQIPMFREFTSLLALLFLYKYYKRHPNLG